MVLPVLFELLLEVTLTLPLERLAKEVGSWRNKTLIYSARNSWEFTTLLLQKGSQNVAVDYRRLMRTHTLYWLYNPRAQISSISHTGEVSGRLRLLRHRPLVELNI